MAERRDPEERERRLAERSRVWRRRNWVLNVLMLTVILAIYLRNCT